MSSEGYLEQEAGYDTKAVHCGRSEHLMPHGTLVPSITLSSTYRKLPGGLNDEFVYSRVGNPSRKILENSIAELEGAKYGLAFGSGVSAIHAVTMLLSSGDHMVVTDDLYGGSTLLWRNHSERVGIDFSYVDARDPQNVEKAIKANTKMIYVETPTNPSMKVIDLRAIADIAKKHPSIITVCDNTLMSPYFQRPLSLGIDISLHSVTKYLNGHCDVIMGATTTNSEDINDRLFKIQYHAGLVPGPHDCYLAFRGIRTLHVRMRQHMQSALHVANFLLDHRHVKQVLHPGLPNHPQHELMKRQSYGCSGMLSFYVRGDGDQTMRFFNNLKIFEIASSLGGYESLAVGPLFSTHTFNPPEELEYLNITDNMVRLSIGLEDPKDLCADLDQALNTACQ